MPRIFGATMRGLEDGIVITEIGTRCEPVADQARA